MPWFQACNLFTTSALVCCSVESWFKESGLSVGLPHICLKTGVLRSADVLGRIMLCFRLLHIYAR